MVESARCCEDREGREVSAAWWSWCGVRVTHDEYDAGDPLVTMRAANDGRLTIVQIESERGVADAEAIAATEGIDCLWIGHVDLTNSLGVPGEFASVEYTRAREKIIAAAGNHGKALGFLAADRDTVDEYDRLGFTMLATGTDTALLTAAIHEVIARREQE